MEEHATKRTEGILYINWTQSYTKSSTQQIHTFNYTVKVQAVETWWLSLVLSDLKHYIVKIPDE